MDALANQRIESGAQSQRQVMAVGEIRQNHRNHRVGRPGIEAPVEITDLDGFGRSSWGAARPGRWRQIVHNRLGDTVEHHADADTRGKQHRKPRQEAVFGLCVVRTELNIAIARKRKNGDDHSN